LADRLFFALMAALCSALLSADRMRNAHLLALRLAAAVAAVAAGVFPFSSAIVIDHVTVESTES
jgi:hypothetical protein